MEKRIFTNQKSIYKKKLADSKAEVLSVEGLVSDDRGIYDVTDRLQHIIDILKIRDRMGIILIPEGKYSIRNTIYIPRCIRLIGYGKNRPEFILKSNTPGFQKQQANDKGNANYMFWFTSNVPKFDKYIDDANPGTFYSAISNINFTIEDGNKSAVVLRTHFAQNSFISHCHFDIGEGKAGIFDVGNEMENLSFSGGEYGIYTTKCSPGWPFVLTNCDFEGQREASIYSRECGLTFSHIHFLNTPTVLETVDGHWEKAFWKDCILENITDTAFKIAEEKNSCTQINIVNTYCYNVEKLLQEKCSGKITQGIKGTYKITRLTLGDTITLGEKETKKIVNVDINPINEIPIIEREILELPDQDEWCNVLDFGAVGDGSTDDTKALQNALDTGKIIYLPQGMYKVSDTLKMNNGSALIGMNPISTQIILDENSHKYAGLGSPKALIETSEGGWNLINSIGIDTASRNSRAVACKWMASKNSYMNDVKFVGGHGQVSDDSEFPNVYDTARKSDVDSDRPWDSQYASLWITNNGGGIFKNIWSASPYAEAGIFISETTTPGIMYQISVEHHVRHEIIMRNVSNWQFYAMQTEEEVAEGSYCQPYELSSCNNLVFGNVYAFRVIWVDNPYPCVFKAWNCHSIEMMCCHNFTQMKYTIDDWYWNMNTGESVGFWQLSKLDIPNQDNSRILPKEIGNISQIAERLDCVDSICSDSKGNYYICDSRLKRIYVWNEDERIMKLLTTMHFRPLSLVCDSENRLIVVCEYKPVPYSKINGLLEIEDDGYKERLDSCGGCYFPFFRVDRQIRVFSVDPNYPEESIEILPIKNIEDTNLEVLYYPHNQWRDSGDIMSSFKETEKYCYLSKDNKTAIVHHPSLCRATGLVPLIKNKSVLLVDEYGKCIIKGRVNDKFGIEETNVIIYRGEYSVASDDDGNIYIPDCLLYVYRKDGEISTVQTNKRPANVIVGGDNNQYLYITARNDIYVMKIK